MFKLFSIFLFFIFFMLGCSKDNDHTNPSSVDNSSSPYFKANINGTYYSADSAIGYIHVDTSLSVTIRVFFIEAYFHHFIIATGFSDMVNSTTLVTMHYDSIHAGAIVDFTDLNDSLKGFANLEAMFRITMSDTSQKLITGTFNGTLRGHNSGNIISITNGSFRNIHYVNL